MTDWNIDDFGPQADLHGTGSDPTHHIVLTDEEVEVGFVITGQDGDRDERTFRRFPHSNPNDPYVTEKQSSWGAGFGQATFEENRTKYWRSKGVDTTKDILVLGPSFHHSKGFVAAYDNLDTPDGVFRWVPVEVGSDNLAMPFTPATQWDGIKYVKVFLRKDGTPPNLVVKLYTDNAGKPGNLLDTTTVTQASITDPDGQWTRIAIDDVRTYSAATKYWVVFHYSGGGKGTFYLGGTTRSVGLRGSAWVVGWDDIIFRIEGTPYLPANAHFVDYKQQLYSLFVYDTYAASALWMNGWRGAADIWASAPDYGLLKDSTVTWSSANITNKEIVRMTAGNATTEGDDQRKVTGTSGGNLTISPNWEIKHAIRDEYVVLNSSHWFQQSAPSGELAGRGSDLAVANGILHICRGNNRGVTWFQGYNKAGVWTNRWFDSGVYAQFAEVLDDPISGDTLWYGYNNTTKGEYKPWVAQCIPPIWDEKNTRTPHVLTDNQGAGNEAWTSSTAECVVSEDAVGHIKLTVTISGLIGVTVTAGGTGYTEDDVVTIVETGSGNTGSVVVGVTGGVVSSVKSINSVGRDYTLGANKATMGGTGSNCTLEITDIVDLVGQFAYFNMYDAESNTRTLDIRNMNYMSSSLIFEHVNGTPAQITEGDLQVELDNNQACGSPFATVNIPNLRSAMYKKESLITLDLDDVSGAEAVTSVALKLYASHSITKSFIITLTRDIIVGRTVLPVDVGQVDGDNITGMEVFGDPESMWVMTEAGFGQVKNNMYLPVPIREIKIARHKNSGVGHNVSDVYLVFTWAGRLQRYYRQNTEDLGPDFPRGMGDIAGDVVSVVSYPGRIYVAIDGGVSARSMILCHKGGGWHEVYTSFSGERIRNLHIQALDGVSDKLWASVANDVMWFPIALDAAELPASSDYTYTPTGYLDSSWVYTSSRELDKLYREMLVTLDRAQDSNLIVTVYFKVDDEDADWIKIHSDKTPYSASTAKYIFTRVHARGNRIRVRLELTTKLNTKSPAVRSTQMRIYRLPEIKFQYSWISKLSTISINLRGDEERVAGQYRTLQSAFDQLDTWAANVTPLRVDSDIASISNKEVVLEPIPAQLLMIVHDEKIEEQSIQVSVNDA